MFHKVIYLFTLLFFSSSVMADKALVLARAPQLSPSAISKLWSPFVESISKKTGIDIVLKVYREREDFEADIMDGKVDMYFGNPGYGVVGYLNHGYIPIIRSDRKLLEGILVARAGSSIMSIEDLNKKIIAFPDRNAFAASLYLRSRISSDFNISYDELYAGSHDNTYRSVIIGKAAAGGGVKRTLERESPQLRKQLKIIYTTPGMKSHPLMAHPSISVKNRISIQQAILDLDKDESGKKLLKSIKLQKPVIADYAEDYKSIEDLVKIMYQSMIN
ncbi:MAG: phosphate/phosphite/phosphonate ABC transporter substrate-binding protein [Gammaproteobacteria bacterium]|nr:phosphate/phosphite/phosphonate ABC transporter substrate-binding protein [Gammaproteobacteria bacterium]